MTLSKEGKAALIEAVNKALDEPIEYRGRNVKRRNTIQMECHRIANSLIRPGMEEADDWEELVEEVDLREERCGLGCWFGRSMIYRMQLFSLP